MEYAAQYVYYMEKPPLPLLTETENVVLRLLGRGKKYKEISEEMKVNVYHIHTLCNSIRRKTGIISTKDAAACASYWKEIHSGHTGILPARVYYPTPAQLAVLIEIAHGVSYEETARKLSINIQTARNHASQGCIKMGIGELGPYRIQALTEWLKKQSLWREADPLDDY